MKMPTREITTAEVLDSPTPLAPPIVVTPQAQLTIDMIAPKAPDLIVELIMSPDLIIALIMSHALRDHWAESNIMLMLIP